MKIHLKDFYKFSLILAAWTMSGAAFSEQAPNPRMGGQGAAVIRADASDARRSGVNASTGAVDVNNVSRTAVQRNAAVVSRSSGGRTGGVLPAVISRSTTNPHSVSGTHVQNGIPSRSATMARTASGNVVRSATLSGASVARSAVSGGSHSGQARATAVFDDVSKIGSGYAACRDAYATCMDQLCANANSNYRRCFCSSRFVDFRNTEAALDEAKTLLMKFEDNNLNAVDKTAAEVSAMYSATVGERAIKKDTSAAQKMLSEIGDLLSGKKKTTNNTESTSMGLLPVDLSANVDEIWSDGGNSLFDSDGSVDMSQLEGLELYNKANTQCLKIIADSCENAPVLNMAKSSYSILIAQDCNAYEKKIDTQREAVKQTVRTAEKYLREARLEEYRAHNSADVNECVSKVKSAITADTACGANYKKCLDYTGAYVNATTGEAIYSQRLFQLNDLIHLDGVNADVLMQNAKFNAFLDDKRMFATSALDTCRDMADIVWTEFKRSALIEIAQAQDALIETVRSDCVNTMKECYDTQADALKSFDDTTAKAAGALSAYAARAMCQDKVVACASLYGDTNGCRFDGNGKLTSGNSNDGKRCGLTQLLTFVDVVDTVRVAEGCTTAINNYVKQLCTPVVGDMGFPWNCRTKVIGDVNVAASGSATASVAANIKQFAIDNCKDPTKSNSQGYGDLPSQTRVQVEKAIADISEELEYQLMDTCETLDGYWLATSDFTRGEDTLLTAFYTTVYGGRMPDVSTINSANTDLLGVCVQNTKKLQCLQYNDLDSEETIAVYDKAKDECIFSEEWYRTRCAMLGNGYYENGICYMIDY